MRKKVGDRKMRKKMGNSDFRNKVRYRGPIKNVEDNALIESGR